MADPFSTFLNTTSGHVSFDAGAQSRLSDEAWRLLDELDTARALGLAELRAATSLATVQVVRLLSELTEQGLVRLTPDDDVAVITSAGRKALHERNDAGLKGPGARGSAPTGPVE